MSENSSQIGAFPMGAGILFAADSLKALENTTPFHSFTMQDYVEWKDKRMYDPRPLQPYEPVGYFDMGTATKIIDKATRYMFPTNFFDYNLMIDFECKLT